MEFMNPFTPPIRNHSLHPQVRDEPVISPMSFYPMPILSAQRGSDSSCWGFGGSNSASDTINHPTQQAIGDMTTEQRAMLERYFVESQYPSVRERRVLTEATGLSGEHVVAWFRKRREETQQAQGEPPEATTEPAGRFRKTTPSSPTIYPRPYSIMFPTSYPPYQAQLWEQSNMYSHSDPTYSRHAAALAHSLAIAAAERAIDDSDCEETALEEAQFQLDQEQSFSYSLGEPHSPFPTSAFSDYGSSKCSSTAYTPSDSEADDPFEYDDISSSYRPSFSFESNTHPAAGLPPPPPDNFSLFAAAIEMKSLSYNFVLPGFPPQKLQERRPNRFGSDGSIQSQPEPAPQDPFAASFAQAASESSESERKELIPGPTDDPMENTLAARRRRPDPNSLRSHSLVGLPDRPVPTLRRINTDEANLRTSRSHADKPSIEEICLDTATTIRPHASAAFSTAPPLSEIFQAGPPTPISPPSPEDVPQKKASPEVMMQKQHVADNEMSPPATPQMSTQAPTMHCDMTTSFDGWPFMEDFAPSIPRHFDSFESLYGGGSSGSSDEDDVFAFDFFTADAAAAAIARTQPLLTTASIASSTTIGCFF